MPPQSLYSVPVYGSDLSARSGSGSNGHVQNTQTIADFQQFINEFRENESFVYRDRLRANCLRKEWTLEVEMGHLIGWKEDLASRCRNEPGDVLPLVRSTFDLSEERSGGDRKGGIEAAKGVSRRCWTSGIHRGI